MPAPPLVNTFDGGADGAAVTAGNSGGPSGIPFDTVNSGWPVYTNVQKHSGPIAMRHVDATGAGWVEWDGLGSLTTATYFRWYMYLAAYPTTNRHYTLRLNTSAAAACAFIRIMADGTGHMSAADASLSGIGAEGAVGISLNQWVRMEARIVASTTVGEIQWKLFNEPESTVSSETSANFTGLVLGANIDQALFGVISTPPATPYTAYFDDLAVSTVDWIGPVNPPALPASRTAKFIYIRKNK